MTEANTETVTEMGFDPNLPGGPSAKRKVELQQMEAPLHVLQQLHINVPHRDFNPENARDYPTTKELPDGSLVHLHQDVVESHDDDFGVFGPAEGEDSEDVVWTVVDLVDDVTITVVGDWGKRRNAPFDEFAQEYEPIYVNTDCGKVPQFGY